MFEKLKDLIGQDRISKRDENDDFTEEAGYYSSDFNADIDTDFSEPDKLQLYFSSVRDAAGKIYHDILSRFNRNCLKLGNKNNRSENLNVIYKCLLCMCICFTAFMFLSSDVIEEDIRISGIRRDENIKTVNLFVSFDYNGEIEGFDTEISVKPIGYIKEKSQVTDWEDNTSWLLEFAEDTIEEICNNSEGNTLVLPSEKDGVKIDWILPKGDKPVWIFAVGLLICLYMYFSKDDLKRKIEKERRHSFELEIPNMIEQLVLILNAGLVTEKAFEELVNQSRTKDNPLYIELARIYDESEQNNAPFFGLLYSFALDFGQRDFLRFATLLYEQSGRGSELAEKLMAEGSLQYSGRLNNAKARIKEAETKLCFPLVLLLIALIIITTAPALMEM